MTCPHCGSKRITVAFDPEGRAWVQKKRADAFLCKDCGKIGRYPPRKPKQSSRP